MAIFEKKWFRFIIFIVLCVALFVSCVVVAAENSRQWNEDTIVIILGSSAAVGQIPAYLAFDVLGVSENGFLRFLRFILFILSAVVFVGVGFISILLYSVFPTAQGMTWVHGLAAMWFPYGIISFYLYYFAVDRDWDETIMPFVQLIAAAAGYFTGVIFAYIGDAAGSFFYGFPIMILSVIAVIVMCVILKSNGLPFSYAVHKNNTNTGNTHTDGRDEKKRKDGRGMISDKLNSAVSAAINSAVSEEERGYYGRIDSHNIKFDIMNNISVYGSFVYLITSNGKLEDYLNDYKKDAEEVRENLESEIEKRVENALCEVKREYTGYDHINLASVKIGQPQIKT